MNVNRSGETVPMNAFWKKLAVAACAFALTACGGGGSNSGTSVFSSASSPTVGAAVGGPVASIDVLPSGATVGTNSTDTVTITATVKNAQNVALVAAPVVFSTDTGTLTSAVSVTSSTGQATATLSAGANKTNRAVLVTVTSGVVSGTAIVNVVSASPASVDVVGSSNRVGTGSVPIRITAVVKTVGNVALANAPIQFSANTGNLVAAVSQTDATGAATALFDPGADKSNRTATITVTSGSVSGTLAVVIDGSSISVAGPSTLALGASTDLSLKVTDSTGAPIAGVPVGLTGILGNIPAGTKVTTDSVGTAKYTYMASNPGADVVTVNGIGVTVSSPLAISGQDFSFTSPVAGVTIPVDPAGISGASVSVRYLINGVAPGAGRYKVRFTSTAGSFLPSSASSGIDLVAGVASVQVASKFAGPSTLQATVFDPAAPNTVVAQSALQVQFIAVTPKSLVLQVSPSAIGPNAVGSTTQQAEARATVLDAASNPVAGVAVNFSKVTDPSGGNLLQASAITDSNGLAKVQYVSGASSTQTDGVTLQATVATDSSVTNTAKLTVNQSALFIALGQGNDISNVNPTTYQKQWTAYVTDSTGAPVPNVTLTISALPTRYGKGSFQWNGTVWASSTYTTSFPLPGGDPLVILPSGKNITCASEDTLLSGIAKNNGFLDAGEDVNGSGKLEPGNVISVNGGAGNTTLKTDATGFSIINLQYAESYAYWVEIALKVSATVAGTESSNTATFFVPGLSADYTQQTVAPAGVVSPFGVVASCLSPN